MKDIVNIEMYGPVDLQDYTSFIICDGDDTSFSVGINRKFVSLENDVFDIGNHSFGYARFYIRNGISNAWKKPFILAKTKEFFNGKTLLIPFYVDVDDLPMEQRESEMNRLPKEVYDNRFLDVNAAMPIVSYNRSLGIFGTKKGNSFFNVKLQFGPVDFMWIFCKETVYTESLLYICKKLGLRAKRSWL